MSAQATNETEVAELLDQALGSLTVAIERLNGDPPLRLQRQWLELLASALRSNGMFGLQEALKGCKGESERFQDRDAAARAITEAERAVREAAGLLYHPKAADELRKASAAIGAVKSRVIASQETPQMGVVAMGPEYRSLKKFAGMLLGQGVTERKLQGLAKARAAWNEKRRLAKEEARLARNRGASRV